MNIDDDDHHVDVDDNDNGDEDDTDDGNDDGCDDDYDSDEDGGDDADDDNDGNNNYDGGDDDSDNGDDDDVDDNDDVVNDDDDDDEDDLTDGITGVFCKSRTDLGEFLNYKFCLPKRQFTLIVLWLTSFSTVFQLYRGGKCTYTCFPGVLELRIIFLPSRWLLSHIIVVETMDRSERVMNPVAMTIVKPRKEYWPSRGSNQDLFSNIAHASLQTDLCGPQAV